MKIVLFAYELNIHEIFGKDVHQATIIQARYTSVTKENETV